MSKKYIGRECETDEKQSRNDRNTPEIRSTLETVRRDQLKSPSNFKTAIFCSLYFKSEKMNIGSFEAEFKNKSKKYALVKSFEF